MLRCVKETDMYSRIVALLGLLIIVGLFSNPAPAQTDKQQKTLEKKIKAAAKQQKALEKKIKTAARQQLHLAEVAVLRTAHVLLTTANGTYAGHRAKAIAHLNEAIKILDARIEDKGLPAQEMQNIRQEAITAYFKTLRKNAPPVVEPQVLSNAQLYQAGQLLGRLRVVLAQNNQAKLLDAVTLALGEVTIALSVSGAK